MLKKQSKNAKITLSILFIFIGLVLISFNYFDGIKNNLFNDKNIKLMNQTISIYEEIKEIDEDEYNNYIFDEPTDEYIGTLIIDKINLNRGFYSINSKYNNVDHNIMVVETSNMPNITNGNLILASHSGSSSISFFKNLYIVVLLYFSPAFKIGVLKFLLFTESGENCVSKHIAHLFLYTVLFLPIGPSDIKFPA